jgi:hypothetical protein
MPRLCVIGRFSLTNEQVLSTKALTATDYNACIEVVLDAWPGGSRTAITDHERASPLT